MAAKPALPRLEIPRIHVDSSAAAAEDVNILIPWDDDEMHAQEVAYIEEAMAAMNEPDPDAHDTLAITALCCFFPFGFVAYKHSRSVPKRILDGDKEGAIAASKSAEQWGRRAMAIGAAIFALVVTFMILDHYNREQKAIVDDEGGVR